MVMLPAAAVVKAGAAVSDRVTWYGVGELTVNNAGIARVARIVVPASVARLVSGALTVGPAPFVTGAKVAVTSAFIAPAGKALPVTVIVLPGCAVAGATEMILT